MFGGLHHGAPSMFFQATRQHGWDDTLASTAVFFPRDIPARPPRRTRHLAEYVMAQVEAPANLDRWTTPEGRLITIILIRCGLRAAAACTLAFDCLLQTGKTPLPALRQPQDAPRGRGPDRRGTSRRDSRPTTTGRLL